MFDESKKDNSYEDYFNRAVIEYKILEKSFGKDQNWDFTDRNKMSVVKSLRGEFMCYCFAIDEHVTLKD